MLAGAQFLVVGPLLAALLTGLLGRWPRVTAVAGAAAAGLLAGWLWQVEPSSSSSFVGRLLLFSEGVQQLFLFLYLGVLPLFLLSTVFPQGRKFVPGSLMALALFALALLIRPFMLGSLFLVAGLLITAVVVQGDNAGHIQGALRYVAQAVIALPFLLVASWVIESEATGISATFSTVLILSSFILLASFPFHVWATSLLNEVSPLVWAFVFGLVQLIGVNFIYLLLTAQPAFALEAQLSQLVLVSVCLTLLVAILLLATAVTIRRFVAGILLIDLASVVATLPLLPELGWATAVTLHVGRFIALIMVAVGFLLLQRANFGSDWLPNQAESEAATPKGSGWQTPLTLLFFIFGCLSLLGVPLTVGFGGRSQIFIALVSLSEQTAVAWWAACLLALAIGMGLLICLRGVQQWFSPEAYQHDLTFTEPRPLQIVLSFIVVVCLFLSFRLDVITDFSRQLAQYFFS